MNTVMGTDTDTDIDPVMDMNTITNMDKDMETDTHMDTGTPDIDIGMSKLTKINDISRNWVTFW
jgi:hypothetical protein